MKQFIYLAAFCVFALAACTPGYKKAENGIEYKIITDGKGQKLAIGNFMQIHITQKYQGAKSDTLLGDTRDYMPRIEPFDSASTPPAYMKILGQTRAGDSVVVRILTDSAYKGGQDMPPFMKKGGYLYTTIKIVNIFTTRDQADSANRAELKLNGRKIYEKQLVQVEKDINNNKAQIDKDCSTIQAYLDKNNIKTIRGKWGTFIEIKSEGTGNKIDFNSVVRVNYTGKTLDSAKVFDSNIDSQFHHTDPIEVTMSQVGKVIFGWSDALMQLKNGTKATIYVPSSLGYGKVGSMPRIKPDAILVFDIEIMNVISEDEAMAIVSENRKKAEAQQKQMLDSLKKIQQK